MVREWRLVDDKDQRLLIYPKLAELYLDTWECGNIIYRRSLEVSWWPYGPYEWYNNEYSHSPVEIRYRDSIGPFMSDKTVKPVLEARVGTIEEFHKEARLQLIDFHNEIEGYYETSFISEERQLLTEVTYTADLLKVVNGRVKKLHCNTKRARKTTPLNYTDEFLKIVTEYNPDRIKNAV